MWDLIKVWKSSLGGEKTKFSEGLSLVVLMEGIDSKVSWNSLDKERGQFELLRVLVLPFAFFPAKAEFRRDKMMIRSRNNDIASYIFELN